MVKDKVFWNTRRLRNKWYSLAWTLMEPGDSSIEFLFRASEMTTVTRAFEEMDLPEN